MTFVSFGMAAQGASAAFRPTGWCIAAGGAGSRPPHAGASQFSAGPSPPCCCSRGPPLFGDLSASLFTSRYTATVQRFHPCFDQAITRNETSDYSCASFSDPTSAHIAVSNSAGSPVVLVAPVLRLPCSSSGMKSAGAHGDNSDDEKGKPTLSTLATVPLVVGLENGQVWLYGWQSQLGRAASEEDKPQKVEDPKCVAQHLVCRQMARPLTVCFSWTLPKPRPQSSEGSSIPDDDGVARGSFEVYVLYSNGVVVVWRQGWRDRLELP